MSQTVFFSLKPADWRQGFRWFTETEIYSFKSFLRRAPVAFDQKCIKKVYAVHLPKERYFVLEFQNYKVLNHLKLTPDQFRNSQIMSEYHLHEVKYNPVHKQVRSDYLRWSILRSPSVSFLIAMILLTLFVAQIKSAWIDNIKEGFWLVSTFCAVKCSKEFAQFVIMLLYLHGVLGLSLFWGPLHYMATYRLHRLSAQRFLSLLETTMLSLLGLAFFFSNFEYNRLEQAAQMYSDYRRGDFGREEEQYDDEEESVENIARTAPARPPASTLAAPKTSKNLKSVKTGTAKTSVPPDKF